jgi:putative effector of murein hydrolase LrgA (UPF0299 family)
MMISLFLFFQSKEKRYAVVSMCLGFANTLTRTDALIFSLVGVGFMLIYSVLKKDWLVTICYAVVSVLPFLIWNQYLANVLHAESSAGYFVKHLFFDADKIAQIGTYLHQYMIADAGFYGISFFLFFMMVEEALLELLATLDEDPQLKKIKESSLSCIMYLKIKIQTKKYS